MIYIFARNEVRANYLRREFLSLGEVVAFTEEVRRFDGLRFEEGSIVLLEDGLSEETLNHALRNTLKSRHHVPVYYLKDALRP